MRITDGLKVTASGSSEFYSTSTFKSAVNFGEYGTVNNTTFYGNVLFENANATATFTSNRAATFNNGLTVSNYLTVYGTFNNYSDINLKTKIETIEKGSLEKILSLQGVTYNFKIDNETEPPRAGFIAQEVQEIFPDLVVEEKEGLALNSLEFIPYLVEAIKEQQVLIEDLQRQVANLSGSQAIAKAAILNDPTVDFVVSTNELMQNSPNPFTEETAINYTLVEGTLSANLMVCDMSGRLIQNYDLNLDGAGQVVISGGELDPGQYIYTLVADGKLIGTKQMILTK